MKWMKVEPVQALNGVVNIPGSKNSSLALLAAACLADESVTLLGIPNIADFRTVTQLAHDVGIKISQDLTGAVHIDSTSIHSTAFDPKTSSSYRTAYYFVGALLAKHGKVSVGYPGGDNFVSRPIDQHFKALKMLGATVTFHQEYYEVEASRLKGADIYFDTISSGATMNSMLAAVLAQGQTILRNAARDPEVTDTANLLNQMGAKISGAGTDTIRIDGVPSLKGCTYRVIPDRLIAGAFLISAGIAGGSITVDQVIPEHLGSCMSKLSEIGLSFDIHDQAITAHSDGKIKATRVRTGMYPGFPTDIQQPLTALLTKASGRSIIGEKVYPHRFSHVQQLRKMGAEIEVRSGVARIKGNGVSKLKGCMVHTSDIRAGICLILAGLMAEGTTMITGVEHIERGYENVVDAFSALGANISIHEGNMNEGSSDLLLDDVL